MKKTLAILLSFLLLFSACTSRSIAPSMDTPSEEKPDVPSVPNVLEQPAPLPPVSENKPQEENDTKKESQEEAEASDDESGDSASGVFRLLDSDYELTLKSPLSGIYDPMAGGFFISAKGDSSFQGIVSYTSDASEVKSIEDNITVLNDTLKADDSVKDFKFDRQKNDEGLYSITFSYRNIGDEYSASGYNYVLYRQTSKGMITVMFTAQDNSYESTIHSVFQSVQPVTDNAVEPPSR